MSIKTLNEILGLSLELKDYEDRVQKRYDYIQEQLEKDPNWIGYDYPEYWTAYIEAHFILKDILVSYILYLRNIAQNLLLCLLPYHNLNSY